MTSADWAFFAVLMVVGVMFGFVTALLDMSLLISLVAAWVLGWWIADRWLDRAAP